METQPMLDAFLLVLVIVGAGISAAIAYELGNLIGTQLTNRARRTSHRHYKSRDLYLVGGEFPN